MDFGQSLLTIVTLALMVITLVISFLPYIPGQAMMWGIALVYGVLTNFRDFSVFSMILITVLMLASALSDFWTPLIGMKARGASCSSVIGTIIGGIVGTFLIPIPLVGTLLGAIAGAILMEILRVGDVRTALRAGSFAAESVVIGVLLEFVVNLVILVIFVVNVAF